MANRKLKVLRQPYGEPGTIIEENSISNTSMVAMLLQKGAYEVVEDAPEPEVELAAPSQESELDAGVPDAAEIADTAVIEAQAAAENADQAAEEAKRAAEKATEAKRLELEAAESAAKAKAQEAELAKEEAEQTAKEADEAKSKVEEVAAEIKAAEPEPKPKRGTGGKFAKKS